jgi:hypothetical protein
LTGPPLRRVQDEELRQLVRAVRYRHARLSTRASRDVDRLQPERQAMAAELARLVVEQLRVSGCEVVSRYAGRRGS